MNNSLLTLCLLLSALFLNSQTSSDHAAGQALVMLRAGADVNEILSRNAAVNGASCSMKIKKTVSKSMNIFLLEFNTAADENAVLEKLRATNGVVIAQFNHFVQNRATVPNDTYFGSMWGLDNTGQSGGVPDADIDAPEAWDIATGGLTAMGDTIVVAVVDGGFQLSHLDLNFWKNYNEISGNGIDDDGNGYIDDVNGWNALNSSGSISSSSHGTHVAGTVGAKGNSGTGTTGISWNVKIMAVQGSTTDEAEAVEAYSYIRDNRKLYNETNGAKGAFVVATNSSFGVDQGQPANYPLWCAMYDSLGAVGILSAAATANQNWNIDNVGDIPTSCTSPYLISVTNTTRNDQKYTGAAYGAVCIDIGAPGTNIYSTVPSNSWQMTGWTGTSMATPHVAGTIGLMYAAACQQFIADYKADPSSKALLMHNYLLSGADVISGLSGMCATNGRLNAYNALVNVQSYSSCTTSDFHLSLDKMEMKGVFPNPAGEFAEIEYLSNEDNFYVAIRDVMGKTIKTIHRTNHKGINRHTIDLNELNSGVYLISIEAEGKSSGFMRFVKL